ncbi:SAM-dependent methyltransferase [Sporosarcina sp. P37]|uniref:class I SAM-dependent methyltransferase n=1 Tax=unclassified Sporosarcina TaxID=2647733 RepID=UPI000A17FB50|nr:MULTISPECIES: class I SAM-dependent methyltransferase [unclassified Sporosarcina]ARK25346.1 SAM-dependent methyltransferase [Sporosarcina sp. P37]PID17144.1 class I SAM-dependent methyltransferase [Sporosarcina sp. P35]
MNTEAKRLPTHLFLAKLGKTKLRPGGREGTDRIIHACGLTKDTRVLEVAPNMGTTAIHLAKTFGCRITGVDINPESVRKAQENIKKEGLEELISIQHGNATALPFEDESFDVVINEAMLTMLPHELKQKALAEYRRVLKPGGLLATHDLLITRELPGQELGEKLQDLRQLILVNAQPMKEEGWRQLFEEAQFTSVDCAVGRLNLLSLKGLVEDEGWDGLIGMIEMARKNKEDEDYFLSLIRNFDANSDLYGHITVVAKKQA